MMNPDRHDNAVSEVVGTILLISLVVIGIGVVAAVVWTQPRAEKIPEFSASITNSSCSVILSHTGGETVSNSTIRVLVDATDLTSSFIKQGTTGPWSSWGIGEILVYTPSYSCIITPKRVDIVYQSGSIGSSISTGFFENPVTAGLAPRAPGTPVSADFSGTPTAGFVPLAVYFTDTSTGSPIAWSWDFGDGGTSTLRNPSHTYTSAQSYTVSLTVHNGTGTSTIIKSGYITTYYPPLIVDFTSDTTSGLRPLPVQFTDQSLGSPVTWLWNFGDGGTSTAQNPAYTYQSQGRYSVSLTVTNASAGTNSTTKTNYITVTPNPPWYCGWNFRKNITIDKNRVSGVLSDFPVLISLPADDGLKNNARTDGYDLLFTSSDGTTKLPHEIETYTSTSGALVAWVKVPAVSSSANTTIYLYYGNATASDQQNKNAVWTPGYLSVWHLKENPAGTAPQMKDSTSGSYHGTSAGSMTAADQVSAKINGGLDLDGTNDEIACTDINAVDGATQLSVEAWIKPADLTRDNFIVSKGDWADYEELIMWRDESTLVGGRLDTFSALVGTGTVDVRYYGSAGKLNDNNWHYVVFTYIGNSATGLRGYVDGVEDTAQSPVSTLSVPSLGGSTADQVRIGSVTAGSGTYFSGLIDEVRISNIVRSADWILTSYRNQNSPSTFHYLGNQEQWTC